MVGAAPETGRRTLLGGLGGLRSESGQRPVCEPQPADGGGGGGPVALWTSTPILLTRRLGWTAAPLLTPPKVNFSVWRLLPAPGTWMGNWTKKGTYAPFARKCLPPGTLGFPCSSSALGVKTLREAGPDIPAQPGLPRALAPVPLVLGHSPLPGVDASHPASLAQPAPQAEAFPVRLPRACTT